MDISVAHIIGAFTEAYRNRQRRKREEAFHTTTTSSFPPKSPSASSTRSGDYMLNPQVRSAEGCIQISSGMSYDSLLREVREKAGMLGIREGRWTIFAVKGKEGREGVVVTREEWEGVRGKLGEGEVYSGLRLECRL